ncbi:unnamed protein product [Amoebophrya sp. A120]|nr:unnamed protein product [Amoebophrya sp. A120]|eukprot:GSA120T00019644001.1
MRLLSQLLQEKIGSFSFSRDQQDILSHAEGSFLDDHQNFGQRATSFNQFLAEDICHTSPNNSEGTTLQFCAEEGSLCHDGYCRGGDVCLDNSETNKRKCITEAEFYSNMKLNETTTMSLTRHIAKWFAGFLPRLITNPLGNTSKEFPVCDASTSTELTSHCVPPKTNELMARIGFGLITYSSFMFCMYIKDLKIPYLVHENQQGLQQQLSKQVKKEPKWCVDQQDLETSSEKSSSSDSDGGRKFRKKKEKEKHKGKGKKKPRDARDSLDRDKSKYEKGSRREGSGGTALEQTPAYDFDNAPPPGERKVVELDMNNLSDVEMPSYSEEEGDFISSPGGKKGKKKKGKKGKGKKK